jgi:hypothetical protein
MPDVMGMIEAYESQARFCENQMAVHFHYQAVYNHWAGVRQDALASSEQLETLAVLDIDRDARAFVRQAA